MDVVVSSVVPGSVASELGFQPGDQVLAVNGRNDLEDLFDYQFEIADSGYLELAVRRTDGSEEIFEIEKEPDEDPGLIFTSPVFTPIKTCNNACPFCFIDQQPAGLRPTLYIKDDDYRLSYFANTYITLTNLTERDRARIECIRPGPLYVSVHCTVPEIREQLLMNRKQAGHIMRELTWLKSLEIPFHCQVVVCPGINDSDALTQTLTDLATLRPQALSVAVVPVGLTQYRSDLPSLVPMDEKTALDVIQRVNTFEASIKQDDEEAFVFLSDEFYFKANLPLPSYDEYADFPQLDDGVGTARMLLEDFYALEAELPQSIDAPQNTVIVTGKLAAMTLQPITARLNQIEDLFVDLIPVENRFWGESVGVAGLITGQDILETLSRQDLTGYQQVVIPSVMLKQGTDLFLDGKTVAELSEALKLPFQVIEDPYSARELMEKLKLL